MSNDDFVTQVRGLCLVLRDLAEQQDFDRITARKATGAVVTYRKGQGATVDVDGMRLEVPEEALDYAGFLPVPESELILNAAGLGGPSAMEQGGEGTVDLPLRTTPAQHKNHSPEERI